MSKILCLETATKNCSVSLSENGQLLVAKELAEGNYTHAENLHVFIQQVMHEANVQMIDLHAIAVSKGPGSYTGLRIGVSAAKGLCYALNIPLIAVDTLAVLAKQIKTESGYIIPMIDARRMEVYTTIFDHQWQNISETKALIVAEDHFSNLNQDLYFIGDGAPKCQEILKAKNFHFDPSILYPSAKDMVSLAYQKFMTMDFEDVAYFEPYYLKEFMVGSK
jgi:tRNA threonylcarbamoyladenosine biosynthesis protein TsaB